MAFKILTKNGIENTNVDGARFNYFASGQRSGFVKGAFGGSTFITVTSNVLTLSPCELIISGHRVVVDDTEIYSFANAPSTNTAYSWVAQIVSSVGNVSFSLIMQLSSAELTQDNLFTDENGFGTYQFKLCDFTLTTDLAISDFVQTAEVITGGGEGDYLRVGEVTAEATDNPSATVTNRYDFDLHEVVTDFGFKLPKGDKGDSGNPTGNILQTTGTSTEDTMSQNAITTQLSKKQNATVINIAGTATNFEITATRFVTEFYCFANATVTITQDETSYYSATGGGQYKIYRRAELISIIRTPSSIALANVDVSAQTVTLANNSSPITLSVSNGYAVGVINELV